MRHVLLIGGASLAYKASAGTLVLRGRGGRLKRDLAAFYRAAGG